MRDSHYLSLTQQLLCSGAHMRDVTSLSHSSYSAVELIMRDSHSLSHSSYSAVELIMRDSHLSLTQQLLCSGAHYEG